MILFHTSIINVSAQSRFNIEANWITAPTDIELENWNQPAVHNTVNGFQGIVSYAYDIPKSKFEPRIGIGFKQLYTTGSSGNQSFNSTTSKLVIQTGTDYKVLKIWRVGLDLVIENNRDFEDFRTSTTDLLRYNLQFKTGYRIYKKLFVIAYYSKTLYPGVDLYFLTNPDHQFGVGLHLNILEL